MTASAVVVGAGAVGARAARQLVGSATFDSVLVVDASPARAEATAHSLGAPARAVAWPSALSPGVVVVVLAVPGDHRSLATEALDAGAGVVSCSSSGPVVERLLGCDEVARRAGRPLVVGAGFTPGLSCLLARHAAEGLDHVDEIRVARVGIGGPACARESAEAWESGGRDWRDGAWVESGQGRGGTLMWFPDPLGGRDCYPAAVGEAALLVQAFPGIRRVSARVAVSRQERLLRRLPMVRRPSAEGLLGGVRVEVRGRRGPATDSVVFGALDRPALAAGIVAGVTAVWVASGRINTPAAAGLATLLPEPLPMLQELARRGVRAATFEGADAERAS